MRMLIMLPPDGILHDPGKFTLAFTSCPMNLLPLALYDDPEAFIPERYLLNEHGTKPGVDGSDLRLNPAFGVGRVSPLHQFSCFLF